MTIITTLPTAPSRADPSTFSTRMDAHLAAMPTFITETNTVAGEVNGYATTATTQAGLAAASAASAVLSPGTSATSTTSVAIAVGSVSITVETGKSLVVGMSVKIASTATPTLWMHGDITAYTTGTGALVVNVTSISGTGTLAAWTVSLSSPSFSYETLSDKTGAYSVVATDLGKIIRTTSGTGAITLPSCATVGIGFAFTYLNDTAAAITVACVGSDTIGAASISVPGGNALNIMVSNASATGTWEIVSRSYNGSGSGATFAANAGTASGSGAIAIGGIASGSSNPIAIGTSTQATAPSSVALGNSAASVLTGELSYASGQFAAAGDAQGGTMVLRRVATVASTNYVLTADGSTPADNQVGVSPAYAATAFSGIVVARQQGAGGTNSAAWKVEGLIRREAGTVSLVGTPTVTSISGTVPTGWTLTCTADTSTAAAAITFNMGVTTMNIRCVANISTVKVTYA